MGGVLKTQAWSFLGSTQKDDSTIDKLVFVCYIKIVHLKSSINSSVTCGLAPVMLEEGKLMLSSRVNISEESQTLIVWNSNFIHWFKIKIFKIKISKIMSGCQVRYENSLA